MRWRPFARQIPSAREIASRLKANPDDAEALALLGESRLDEGNLPEAVANLRKAYQLENKLKLNNTRTWALLGEALIGGAPLRFCCLWPPSQGNRADLERFGTTRCYTRIMAEKLRIAGQWARGL